MTIVLSTWPSSMPFSGAPLQLSFQHVMGHQDKDPQCKLTTIEQLNNDCDHWVK